MDSVQLQVVNEEKDLGVLVIVMARYIVSYRISRYWDRIVAYPYRDNYPSKNRYSAQL